jgi:CheY-like chemotaxis protein
MVLGRVIHCCPISHAVGHGDPGIATGVTAPRRRVQSRFRRFRSSTKLEPSLLTSDGHKRDIVLMGVCLDGGREGIEAARWLREVCEVPVVFVTGYNDPDTIERIHVRVPGAPVLPKPVAWLLFLTGNGKRSALCGTDKRSPSRGPPGVKRGRPSGRPTIGDLRMNDRIALARGFAVLDATYCCDAQKARRRARRQRRRQPS